MVDKSHVQSRLQRITPLSGVYPTARQPLGSREQLDSLAYLFDDAEIDRSDSRSIELTRSLLADDVAVEGSGLELLADGRDGTEQLAAFARAGYNFFKTSSAFENLQMHERQARGANGTVRRVLTEGPRILLETQRIVVGVQPDVEVSVVSDLLTSLGVIVLGEVGVGLRSVLAYVESGIATDVCLQLMESDLVRYAEPSFVEYIGSRSNVPTDPLIAQQWHLAVLDMQSAWANSTGVGTNVTVIDNGFQYNHPDLNPDVTRSAWYYNTPDADDAQLVPSLTNMPFGNHGTACAGMLGAAANGVLGVGIAYDSPLALIACLEDQIGSQTTLARALGYAAAIGFEKPAVRGADVIACSLGPSSGARWPISHLLSDAIDAVTTDGRDGNGTVLVWACSNGNVPITLDEVCSHPNVIAVGRSTQDDRDHGSATGPELAFLAPGVDVLIASGDGGYQSTTGTSFACPCAAGVAALVLSREPTLTRLEVRQRLLDTCVRIGPLPYTGGRNDTFGAGRIDPVAATM